MIHKKMLLIGALVLSIVFLTGCKPGVQVEINNDILLENNISCKDMCLQIHDNGGMKIRDGKVECNVCICYSGLVCDDCSDKCCE